MSITRHQILAKGTWFCSSDSLPLHATYLLGTRIKRDYKGKNGAFAGLKAIVDTHNFTLLDPSRLRSMRCWPECSRKKVAPTGY